MDADGANALVATKLTAPTLPPQLIDRPRLTAVLDAAVADSSVRAILVSAPAGSGKSTLVAGWQSTRDDCAWLQADPADRDPARFWGHLVGALAGLVPDIVETVGPAVSSAAGDAGPLLERLANVLASGERVTLVIDDYHLVVSPAIDDAIDALIGLAPSTFRLVLVTRLDPSIRLSRLRVRSQLVEVRADELSFAATEAQLLLRDADPAVTLDHAEALCERTEGWAAGLVLAGLSLRGSDDHDAFVEAFQGDDRLVVDYLTDEYLSQVDEADQSRMMRTAVLDRMCGPLIDAVCGTNDGARWLNETAATNQLLISLDRTNTWFRYHHLLGDVLRLDAEQSSIDLTDAHRQAARWHHQAGDAHNAVEHYLAANELTAAADLIYDEATDLMNRGQLSTVADQVARLGTLAEEHAGALVVQGWIALFTGHYAESHRCVARARTLNPNNDEAALSVALAIMTNLATGNVDNALSEARSADEPFESTQAMALAGARVWAGDFDGARPFLEQAERMAPDEGHRYVQVVAPIFSAIGHIECNDAAAAHAEAARAIDLADLGLGDLTQTALAHSILARTTEHPDEAVAAATHGVELVSRSPEPILRAYVFASGGDVLSHHGHDQGADLIEEARRIIDECPDPGIAGRYLARVEARHQLSTPQPASPGFVEDLTDRELAVLRYLPSPMSQREIANELYVSLNTVKTHCKAVYRKLGTGDRKAAVQAARDHGLL
ncbi:helix-turn-helix transcriptional regulator [Ilumatobacter nonamiensis]|uniref:helix-turn-helix transcriptional regulator n=1 Tax=Ilumatobacter nonamiensis TaxID=467093 RepID=UPI000344E1D8|nr:LuxR C-terminal-related transcriptional regulator [Ilumatobacter nonamiensis]